NAALRKQLGQGGISDNELPAPEAIVKLRYLSHRQRAVELLPRLQMSPGFCGQSAYLTDAQAWKDFVETNDHSLLKAPLSGS
ncbi:MAG: hypothetical protein RR471_08595, partial [Bacteroides sp.]